MFSPGSRPEGFAMPYKFFLSYSRMDATGGTFLSDFFRRLEIEVAQAAGLSAADLKKGVGFFDQLGIEPGDKWPAKLDEALGTSDVLICLYSNSYFNSPACGKEFEVFRSRVRSYTPPPG